MAAPTVEREASARIVLDLPRDVSAPSAARRALDEAPHGLDYEGEQAAKLLLSELVTNSVKYGGGGPVRVEIECRNGGLRVEVVDPGPGFTPTRRSRCLDEVGGWGLVLVEELASRWGKRPGCCHIWFEIDS